MSTETTSAPVAPTTPAVTPATTTTEASAPVVTPPQTITQAKETAAQWRERVNQRAREGVAPSPAVTTTEAAQPEQPRGPDGRFTTKPAGDEPAASSQVLAPASEGEATTTQAGGEPASDVVQITLPEDHPLRARGIAELPFAVPKAHEEIVRSLLNEPVRKQQIAQAHEAARQAERRALELQAEAQFWRENSGEFLTPEFYAQYADIKQTYGDAAAETFKAGQMEAARRKLDARRQEVSREMAAQETVATARQFRTLAMQDALQRFPGWTQPEMDRAFQAYGAWISATGATEPKAEDWYMIATPLYEGSAAGQARKQQEAQRIAQEAAQRATEEARQREQQALEQAAQARARNPLGAVPNVQTGLAVPGAQTGPRTAAEFKQQLAQRARGY